MLTGLSPRLTYANVMSTIAVFVALGGSAYAVATIGPGDIEDDAVRARHIADDAVRSNHIKTGVVKSSELGDGAVATADIGDGAVASADIGDGGIASVDVGDGQIGSVDLAALAVTAPKLGALAVRSNSTTPFGSPQTGENANVFSRSVTASCQAGERLLGGSSRWQAFNDEELYVTGMLVDGGVGGTGSNVSARGATDLNVDRPFTVQAICLKP